MRLECGAAATDRQRAGTVDIVVRSYYRDLPWLRHCLASIGRHCTGFRRTVLVVPHSSIARLRWAGLSGDVTASCDDVADDYLGQQVTKLTAPAYSDADYICHVDSDCLFQRPTTPADLIDRDGRPTVLTAPYGALSRHVPWRGLTEEFLGAPVTHEFMRSPPYTFPQWIYGELDAHCRRRHGVPLPDYVLSRPPRGFSEFNALGAFAFTRYRDAFRFLDVTVEPVPPQPCRVFWSRRPPDDRQRQLIATLLA